MGSNSRPSWKQFPHSTSELLAGYPIRIVDGNPIGGSEHRLQVLRQTRSGALPGQVIAVLNPQQMLVVDAFPCEDGHAQERSLFAEILRDDSTWTRVDRRSQFLYSLILDGNCSTPSLLRDSSTSKSALASVESINRDGNNRNGATV